MVKHSALVGVICLSFQSMVIHFEFENHSAFGKSNLEGSLWKIGFCTILEHIISNKEMSYT